MNLGFCFYSRNNFLLEAKRKEQKEKSEEIQVHTGCGGEVKNIGEDGISFCTRCEVICEGDTEYITEEEFEKQ